MEEALAFIKDNLKLITEEKYREDLEKIVGNEKVAKKAMADNKEKEAYLFALYVNNAIELGCYLFRNDLLTDEITAAFHKLPKREDATNALKPFVDDQEAERTAILERQQAWVEHNKGLDVFKGIALGDSPEEAKEGVERHAAEQAQAEAQMAQRG